ncbi:uncharacterized protein LAESUDRAFT_693936 [Laetiporus sulphureus 93-53]|uniref:RNA-dependent RNA polymerase n=1 Tax=Laetiporus sulphureus 93-53 TaxID=1314785 RepID=A0A165GHL2_9APHY|nr:uncharacterized protein LAESUDRAFT_693936 [Laetiporus sulphureus 93-53]KZT10358.1 hypothetical protein LAESUDRAFT_693936 [Laetiporus sulphureus 93-53]
MSEKPLLTHILSSTSLTSQSSQYSDGLEAIDDYIRALPTNFLEEDEEPALRSAKRAATEDIETPRATKAPRRHSSSHLEISEVPLISGSPISSGRTLIAESDPTAICEPLVIASAQGIRWGYIEKLPWGAQWEISRLLNAGLDYDKITIGMLIRLGELNANATAAPEVSKLVANELSKRGSSIKAEMQDDVFASAFLKERKVKLPWEELDWEEAALMRNPHGGLGLNDSVPDPGWYGGKVHFTAKVVVERENKTSTIKIKLDKPHLGSSNHFARRFGSRRFIRVRIPKDFHAKAGKDMPEDALLNYFRRPVVIMGRVFRAFYAKEQNVFLFQTNELFNGKRILQSKPRSCKVKTCNNLSFLDFINFHNNMELNREQASFFYLITMVKWAARFALGLSNSVPGAKLSPSMIAFEDDIACDSWIGTGKVPNEQNMTDGCGFIRADILCRISDRMGWSATPKAIQMRCYGSKLKIKLSQGTAVPEDVDPAKLIIDIVRPSRLTTPARLSTETIINFAENGVPSTIFVKLMQQSMEATVAGLTTWETEVDLFRLWMNVARAGGVVACRLAREAAGAARARGFVFEDLSDKLGDEDEDGFDELDKALEEHSTAWWADPISGCPSTLEETVMVLLDAGFHPRNCPVLGAKLKEVVKKSVTVYAKKFRTDVAMSCTAFIVPDPFGVLEPGQVHIKSSKCHLLDQAGNMTDQILGDVLVTRHPCKVPTDVQKVKAVYHEKLRNYMDVIVISTKNHTFEGKLLNRHLASMTGGAGDYDGDTMEAYWLPDLVEPFRNADPRFAVEPATVQACLGKNKETVAEFIDRWVTGSCESAEVIHALQPYLLGALKDSNKVGIYSTYWENSIYSNGYSHETTIFLAYIFCEVLDGSKSGVTVSPEKFMEHQKTFAHRAPEWKETDEDREAFRRSGTNAANLQRDKKKLGTFIMDTMCKEAQRAADKQFRKVEELFNGGAVKRDDDLCAPWLCAVRRAAEASRRGQGDFAQKELDTIKKHVEWVYESWRSLRNAEADEGRKGSGSGSKSKHHTKAAFTALPIEKRQDTLRELSRKFHSGPPVFGDSDDESSEVLLHYSAEDVRMLRASYAYIFDYDNSKRHWSRFPWDVSMRELCEIKARALGGTKMLRENFYARMTIAKAFLH